MSDLDIRGQTGTARSADPERPFAQTAERARSTSAARAGLDLQSCPPQIRPLSSNRDNPSPSQFQASEPRHKFARVGSVENPTRALQRANRSQPIVLCNATRGTPQ